MNANDPKAVARAVRAFDALVEIAELVEKFTNDLNGPWWRDCENRGGFDCEKVEMALKLARED